MLPATLAEAYTELKNFAADHAQLGSTSPIVGSFGRTSTVRRSAVLLLFGGISAAAGMHLSTHNTASTITTDLQLLLTQRAKHLRLHPRQIAFPGGGFDAQDSSLITTALRETAEETGILAEQIEVLGYLNPLPVPVSNNLVTPVIGWWHTPGALKPDTAELSSAFTVPVQHLLNPKHRGIAEFRNRTRTPGFLLPAPHTTVVWGFTAYVLSELFSLLEWGFPVTDKTFVV